MNKFELNGVTYNVSLAEEDGTTTYTVHCSQSVGGRVMFVLQHDGTNWIESQQVSILRQAEPDALDFLLSGVDIADDNQEDELADDAGDEETA